MRCRSLQPRGTWAARQTSLPSPASRLRYQHTDNIIAGLQQTAATQGLIDVRKKLAEMVEHIDILMGEDTRTRYS